MSDNPALKKLLGNAARDISGAFASRLCTLGIELGLFKALASAGELRSRELARETGLMERYVREWMYGVALAGYIDFDKKTRRGV